MFGSFMMREMDTDPRTVTVVLDRKYGEHLAELSVPVWVVDSPVNREAVNKAWSSFPDRSHLHGVTSFTAPESISPEQVLMGELETIDLHHGPCSAEFPYVVLRVIGAILTAKLEEALRSYGFASFDSAPDGFIASRSHA